jgi:hypothetical protein
MEGAFNMYHSITFGDKNTYDDWHLAPSSRPVFNPPKPKTKYLDIPGASSSIDLSESLTSFPLYEDREGEIEFYVLNGFQDWQTLYSEIMNYLHGKRMNAVLEDDLSYHYEGRFSVDKWKSDSYWSKITISYKANPYKWKNEKTTDDWIWDTFNFETDVILIAFFRDLQINSNTEWSVFTFNKDIYGSAPVSPKFIVRGANDSGIQLRFVNKSIGLDKITTIKNGTTQILDYMFSGDECSVYFKGIGTVSLEFNVGRL